MCIFATYRLEYRYLSSFKVVVGLNIFSIVAVEICKLRRHPLKTLVVVFARRRRQGWLVGGGGGIVLRDRQCLDRGHDILGRVHGSRSIRDVQVKEELVRDWWLGLRRRRG